MSAPLVLPYLVLAAVLLLSGVAKLADRRATEDMFVSLQVPLLPAAPSARVLPYAEIALGLGLLVVPAPAVTAVAVATVLLFLAYWGLIARALTFDPPVSCACFGRLGGHRVTVGTLVRNTILVALAVVALVAATQGVDALDALRDADAADAGWLALVAATVALVWLVARTDPTDAPPVTVDEEGDYERVRIPYGVLEDTAGEAHTLRELAVLQARMLVMISRGCGSCTRTAQRLDEWATALDGRIAVHAVYKTMPDPGDLLLHRRELVMREPDGNVSRVLGTIGTPMAVLLGTDGLLAGGPVVGEDAIFELVDDLMEQLAEASG